MNGTPKLRAWFASEIGFKENDEVEDMEDVKEVEDGDEEEDVDEMEDVEDVEDVDDVEDVEDVEDIDDVNRSEDVDDTVAGFEGKRYSKSSDDSVKSNSEQEFEEQSGTT